MVEYDPSIIRRYAQGLYDRADSIVLLYAVLGGLAGAAVGYAIAVAVRFDVALGAVGGIIVLALIGYAYGESRAFWLRLQAQTALCQVQIEQNTRTVATTSDGTDEVDSEAESWGFPHIDSNLSVHDLLDAVDVAAADLWDQVAIDHDGDLFAHRSEIQGGLDDYRRATEYLAAALGDVTARDHGGDATLAAGGLVAALRALSEYISILETIIPETDVASIGSRLQAVEDRMDDAYARFKESILRFDPEYEPAFDATEVA
ncbi:MAG: hypothetical protein KGK34_02445 [Chloroflexota bacterium]|nr:hypothetical protein [Chloroflexota bacterium]